MPSKQETLSPVRRQIFIDITRLKYFNDLNRDSFSSQKERAQGHTPIHSSLIRFLTREIIRVFVRLRRMILLTLNWIEGLRIQSIIIPVGMNISCCAG